MTKARFAQTIAISLIAGLIYLNQQLTQTGIQNIIGAIFFLIINQSIIGVLGVLQVFPLELPVFHREHTNGMYRPSAYYLAKSIAELPFQIFFPAMFVSITYWMIGNFCFVLKIK